MNYWLHPEAQDDLREAAGFYREQAGTALSQSFLAVAYHSRRPGYWRGGLRSRRRTSAAEELALQVVADDDDEHALGELELDPDCGQRGAGERGAPRVWWRNVDSYE